MKLEITPNVIEAFLKEELATEEMKWVADQLAKNPEKDLEADIRDVELHAMEAFEQYLDEQEPGHEPANQLWLFSLFASTALISTFHARTDKKHSEKGYHVADISDAYPPSST